MDFENTAEVPSSGLGHRGLLSSPGGMMRRCGTSDVKCLKCSLLKPVQPYSLLDWGHFLTTVMHMLVSGPSCEERGQDLASLVGIWSHSPDILSVCFQAQRPRHIAFSGLFLWMQ